jgi:hypothetical protein
VQLPPIGLPGLVLVALIVAATLAGMARVAIVEFARGVHWHDLRVRCHRMRRERLMMLMELQSEQDELHQRAAGIAAIGARTNAEGTDEHAGDDADHADRSGEAVAAADPVAGRVAPAPRSRAAA